MAAASQQGRVSDVSSPPLTLRTCFPSHVSVGEHGLSIHRIDPSTARRKRDVHTGDNGSQILPQ